MILNSCLLIYNCYCYKVNWKFKKKIHLTIFTIRWFTGSTFGICINLWYLLSCSSDTLSLPWPVVRNPNGTVHTFTNIKPHWLGTILISLKSSHKDANMKSIFWKYHSKCKHSSWMYVMANFQHDKRKHDL